MCQVEVTGTQSSFGHMPSLDVIIDSVMWVTANLGCDSVAIPCAIGWRKQIGCPPSWIGV